MEKLAGAAERAKKDADASAFAKALGDAKELDEKCAVAIDGQRLLLALHVSLRAGLVAYGAGSAPPDLFQIALNVGVAAAQLSTSIRTLAEGGAK
jgi:hypothetical protein